MLGFQASNRGTMNAVPWFEHVKMQALAAKQVAKETGIGSVWSWGWIARNAAQADPDKEAAACVYLWARDPRLQRPRRGGTGLRRLAHPGPGRPPSRRAMRDRRPPSVARPSPGSRA